MPVLPESARPAWSCRGDLTLCFQALDHGNADTVLDGGDGVEEFELGQKVGLHTLLPRQLVEANDGRVSPIVSMIEL